MTLQQLKAMPAEELRARLLESLGWERFSDKDAGFGHEYWARFGHYHFKEDTAENGNRLPDYLNDLNACRDMTETLEGQQREDFLYILSIIAGEGTPDYKWKFINSTARQRCEAFVAVKSREV